MAARRAAPRTWPVLLVDRRMSRRFDSAATWRWRRPRRAPPAPGGPPRCQSTAARADPSSGGNGSAGSKRELGSRQNSGTTSSSELPRDGTRVAETPRSFVIEETSSREQECFQHPFIDKLRSSDFRYRV